MIVIKVMSTNMVKEIDNELGYSWREGALPRSEFDDCVDVTLGESVIFKAYTDGSIVIDIGGYKAFLPSGAYKEVTIT